MTTIKDDLANIATKISDLGFTATSDKLIDALINDELTEVFKIAQLLHDNNLTELSDELARKSLLYAETLDGYTVVYDEEIWELE